MPADDNYGASTSGWDQRRDDAGSSTQHLTNEDFRKLMMTPRVGSTSAPKTKMEPPKSERKEHSSRNFDVERAESRRNKKKFYASLVKSEEDKLAELALKYRDRAKERRDGANPDYQGEDLISTSGAYKAVAPDLKSNLDAAERRKQMIQESKFLGGDMEHTHLVKGLDYALLQKVRSEITNKEKEDEVLEEILTSTVTEKEIPVVEEESLTFKTMLGKNIHRILFKPPIYEKNELFMPGRMAYVIDLEDDFAESDIPTTVLRSKADCPLEESQTIQSTNDIVINKLTQILSYLRQGIPSKKRYKKDKPKLKEEERMMEVEVSFKGSKEDDSIYGNIGDYIPSLDKRHQHMKELPKEIKMKEYFDKKDEDLEPERKKPKIDKGQISKWSQAHEILERSIGDRIGKDELRLRSSRKPNQEEPDSYAECYPGAPETEDAVLDSDDEVDYSKMDMGNKKGPIGRWDFDTQEEYSDYMSNKEAMPKAAFQYGVKMADGRKTRRTGKKDEKTKLDRDFQKISQIISKRKAEGSRTSDMEYQKPRF